MKRIVHLNANISHSSVPLRLAHAFERVGISSDILTMQTNVKDVHVQVLPKSFLYRGLRKIDYIFYLFGIRRYPNRNDSMPFSHFYIGINLVRNNLLRDADVIIIHWIGGSYLSCFGLKRILKLGKQVIIVCHDNGHFTGGCHVRMGCEKYTEQCGKCPQLGSNKLDDWSYRMLIQRKRIFGGQDILVVSPSRWMDGNVAKSVVFHEKKHIVIPNPVDIDAFCPGKRFQIRANMGLKAEERVILFGAINAVTTPYKGYDKLLEALAYFTEKHGDVGPITAYVFGQSGESYQYNEQFRICFLGYLEESGMIDAYRMADAYVVPSLEDSFNNTVAEALAVETPVVSFATGGIVDIIDHKINGYLAEYGSVTDLAEGLYWIMTNNEDNRLGKAGRNKVQKNFSYEVVAKMWRDVLL